jgi:hypothetical protein
MNFVKAGSKMIGPGQPCFIIAEAGVNHNGDMGLALQLVDAAVAATPTTMPAVETIPSLAPRTPARSQFNFEDNEPMCGSAGCGFVDTGPTLAIE